MAGLPNAAGTSLGLTAPVIRRIAAPPRATTSARTRSQISAAMTPASTSRVMIWSRVIVPLPDPTLYYGRGPTANIEIVVTFCGRPPSGVQFSSMFLLGFDNEIGRAHV